MENDSFDDIEINLSEPTYTEPEKNTSKIPPKNEIPQTHKEVPCGCGHHHED